MSVYPAQIDSYGTLPLVQDLISPIVANDHNSLVYAVLAIENTLGVNPAGTYSTVAEAIYSVNDSYALIEAHIGSTTGAHLASAISITDPNNLYLSNNVEGALNELGAALPAKPNTIGENQLGVPNTGYPTFVGGYGTKFVFNSAAPTPQQSIQPFNITGFTIIEVSQQTPSGTGVLKFTPAPSTLYWLGPGDALYGAGVNVSGLSSGQWVTLYSNTSTTAIRVAFNGSAVPVTLKTDTLEIYAMNAQAGEFSYTGTGFFPSSFITHAAPTPSSATTSQFVISGIVFPADNGTLVLQRKLRGATSFNPVAILDLAGNFNNNLRNTNQPVYTPSYTATNGGIPFSDTIMLYDRFPVLGDYSVVPYTTADGYYLYQNYEKSFYNYQVAKYVIPVSNSSIAGGSGLLTAPPSDSALDINDNVSAYRVVHYLPGITNFGGNPTQSEIYSVVDSYGSSNDGNNTVRMSNIYLDPATAVPTVSSLTVAPVNSTPGTSKVISGISYYNGSDTFNVDAVGTNFFANTYDAYGILNFNSDVLTLPIGNSIGVTDLFDSSDNAFSTSNLPVFSSSAYYYADGTHGSSYASLASNLFSARTRISAYAADPFVVGTTIDAYGTSNILVNSYSSQSSTDSTEYFVDEVYRLSNNAVLSSTISVAVSPFVSYVTDGYFNSYDPLVAGELQVGGIMGSTTPYIGGLIFPQENFTAVQPTQQSGTNYSSGFSGTDSTYLRLFSLNATFSEGVLVIQSNGVRPVVFNDLYYLNASRPLKIELQLPGVTGWLDIGRLYGTGLIQDGYDYGCLDSEPYIDTGTGYLSLPFTFGEYNNSTTSNLLAVRVTYFSSQYSVAKNIILTQLKLQFRNGVF